MKFATNKRFASFCLLILASIFNVCGASSLSSYDQLCQIYSEIAPQPMPLSIKEGKLADSVESKMPIFFKSDYENIITADRNKRFALIKSLADNAGHADWQCKVMYRYFSGDFD